MSGRRPTGEVVHLVEMLAARQQELKQPDGAFSRKLGICRTMWVATRSGKRQVGLALLRGVGVPGPGRRGAGFPERRRGIGSVVVPPGYWRLGR